MASCKGKKAADRRRKDRRKQLHRSLFRAIFRASWIALFPGERRGRRRHTGRRKRGTHEKTFQGNEPLENKRRSKFFCQKFEKEDRFFIYFLSTSAQGIFSFHRMNRSLVFLAGLFFLFAFLQVFDLLLCCFFVSSLLRCLGVVMSCLCF